MDGKILIRVQTAGGALVLRDPSLVTKEGERPIMSEGDMAAALIEGGVIQGISGKYSGGIFTPTDNPVSIPTASVIFTEIVARRVW